MTRFMNFTKKGGSSAPHHLLPRKVKFDWQHTPIDWLPEQPFTSHFLNALHLLLPGGELWMCRMLNKALPQIQDAKLREDMIAFVRQEAIHANAHHVAVEDYLKVNGLYPEQYMQAVNWLYTSLLADSPLGITIKSPRLTQEWLKFRIGAMAALEHMTCVLGQYVLDQSTWDKHQADPVLLDLFRWHGAEEVEHRCVAFDVYNALDGTYWMRIPTVVLVFGVVMGYWCVGAGAILQQHPHIRAKHIKPGPLKGWFWKQWSLATQKDFLPSLGWVAKSYKSYLSPRYNPMDEGSTEQALAYLARSKGYLTTAQPARA